MGQIRRFMSGGGGRGELGSKVVAGEFAAAAALSPMGAKGSTGYSPIEHIKAAIAYKSPQEALGAIETFPGAVVNSAWQMVGLAFAGGVVRALGRWVGF